MPFSFLFPLCVLHLLIALFRFLCWMFNLFASSISCWLKNIFKIIISLKISSVMVIQWYTVYFPDIDCFVLLYFYLSLYYQFLILLHIMATACFHMMFILWNLLFLVAYYKINFSEDSKPHFSFSCSILSKSVNFSLFVVLSCSIVLLPYCLIHPSVHEIVC